MLIIPKGFIKKEIIGGPGEFYRNEYIYRDSSTIYITDEFEGGLNYSNIAAQGHASYFLIRDKKVSDTATFAGIDKNGLFWKHFSAKTISVGYIKVQSANKSLYDNALNTIRYK